MHQQHNPLSTKITWSRRDEKLFEGALIEFSEDLPDRWKQIADRVGKSIEQVAEYYQDLVHDVDEIDSGHVELPCYKDDHFNSWEYDCNEISSGKTSTKQSEVERKKGTPWSEHEHRLFLIGLDRYGKGDWRSISRNVVITRTPTQVASHAQKFFLRQTSMNLRKERKRSSIHDITTVDENKSSSLSTNQSFIPSSGAPVQQPFPVQDMPVSMASHLPDQEGSIRNKYYIFPCKNYES